MQTATFRQELGLCHAPRLWHDRVIVLAAFGGLLAGLTLHWLMPVHYASGVWQSPMLLFGFIVWQPVLEEFLFRGVLQGQFLRPWWGRKSFWGISAANTLTAVLFVLLHLVHHAPIWALAVFPPAIVFGTLRERHGSIVPSVLMHAFYNAVYACAGL